MQLSYCQFWELLSHLKFDRNRANRLPPGTTEWPLCSFATFVVHKSKMDIVSQWYHCPVMLKKEKKCIVPNTC